MEYNIVLKTLQYIISLMSISFLGINSQICVLPGTCNTTTTPSNVPDIRIVSSVFSCPAGLVQCYGTAVIQCGTRYVTPVSEADGDSTAGAHPWQVYMMNQTAYIGSGVLVDQYHVLTAAHKVNSSIATPSNLKVYLGVWDPTNFTGVLNRTAVGIVVHPQFNSTTLYNDIAVVRVDQPVPISRQATINTACLPTQGASYLAKRCVVAGWGQTQFSVNDSPTKPQKQVTIPIVDYNTCRVALSNPSVLGGNVDKYLDPTGEICAGGEKSRDACSNDGGAPLMCTDPTTSKWTVAGLVLWGKGCGLEGIYGVYVNVPYYRNWIDGVITTFNG